MAGKQGFASMDKQLAKQISSLGGRAGTGHKFAHGVISASAAGKLGGRPAGYKLSEATKARHGQFMKAYWQERREAIFTVDDSQFGDGFFRPTRRSRLLNKLRSK